ncbi:MAG: hypothetical protein DMG07_04565 [Acidobacteria bacterium]|nr:MAG: hypothetical protein DMG07_04565 [Acidobacteriota bacterium]
MCTGSQMPLRVPSPGVVCLFAAAFVFGLAGAQESPAPKVSFNGDVAGIIYKSCAPCHRPGGMAPMSLLTYKDARPWAKSIREAVAERKMPPWHANPRYGEFRNDRRLTNEAIRTLVAWVEGGALKGDERDLPPAPSFTEGWRIGKPDVVLSMEKEYTLQAQGPDEYQFFVIPAGFKEDRWIQAAEARPGNSRVVHHLIAFIQPKRSADGEKRASGGKRDTIFFKDGTLIRVAPDVPVYDNGCGTPEGGQGVRRDGSERDVMPDLLAGEAPGRDADVWEPGQAKRLPAGADILLQVHYSRNGSVEKDRSSVGLIFATRPPEHELKTVGIANHYFRIPPGADNHEVASCYTFGEDVHLTSLMPHMHVRGKNMQYRAYYPDGRSEILLSVPSYSFNWQTTYYLKKPIALPKGTRLEVKAHFDNSPRNPTNPDPAKAVRWGDPTYDEMMIGWIDYYRDGRAPVTASSGR